MASYLVLLGPPGAGKGTQAKRLAANTGLAHISSGDIFRQHLKESTELGKKARVYIDRGELVPDDVTIAMIRERLSRPDCKAGAILDGFPRTTDQAAGLDDILGDLGGRVDRVLFVAVPDDELIRRLSGRLVCRAQGHIYQRDFNPPQEPGVCDVDGSELYQRDDDKEETVRHRIQVYRQQTAPLIEYYRQRSLLTEIEGGQPVEQVTADMLAAIGKGS